MIFATSFFLFRFMQKHNFTPGPAILPQSVTQNASEAIINFNNTGLSLLEISHRDKLFIDVIEGAINIVKNIYRLNDGYEVLFMQGGASAQFAMVPMNFLSEHETAAIIDTGVWSAKVIQETKLFGNVNVVASSADKNYSYIPKDFIVPYDARYLHITTNNTIYGSQFHEYPKVNVPMVADMSSDIFSKEIDATKFDLIYAGAQKNAGAAGTTIVIVKKDFLNTAVKNIPAIFDYKVCAANGSLYNTPSVFAVYVCYLTLQWLQEQGGLKAIEEKNKAKAALLYNMLDNSSLFKGNIITEDRSLMNVTFVLNKPELENDFLAEAKAAGIVGIKGHRLSGGFRASLYNALPVESVQVLVDVMKEFEKKNG
jgi:phosphoserine aminotransferase